MGKRLAEHTLGIPYNEQIPTSEMLFSMVYGIESVIPVEIGILSFNTSNFDKENNEIELNSTLISLMKGGRELR